MSNNENSFQATFLLVLIKSFKYNQINPICKIRNIFEFHNWSTSSYPDSPKLLRYPHEVPRPPCEVPRPPPDIHISYPDSPKLLRHPHELSRFPQDIQTSLWGTQTPPSYSDLPMSYPDLPQTSLWATQTPQVTNTSPWVIQTPPSYSDLPMSYPDSPKLFRPPHELSRLSQVTKTYLPMRYPDFHELARLLHELPRLPQITQISAWVIKTSTSYSDLPTSYPDLPMW